MIFAQYKVQARIWCRQELTVILPLCLCNSIGGCISKTGHLGTNKNSSRPTSSWNSPSFLIHLFVSAPPSTSAEDKTHFGFPLLSFRSSSLKLSAKPWVHARCLPLGHSDYHSMRWQHFRLFLCSTAAQQSSPLSIHLSCLAGWCTAMSGMSVVIRETHYDPKSGDTLRQLGSISYKRNVYCSTWNLSIQMAGILLQTEIDRSCQTKVSVPVNTELRFPSSMWHDYVLTKRILDNQLKETKKKKKNCFTLQHGIDVKACCAPCNPTWAIL